MLQGLDTAMSCVEDMDEWLGIFNVKLRHMREDIESVGAHICEVRCILRPPMFVVAVPQKVIVHMFSFFYQLKACSCINVLVAESLLCQCLWYYLVLSVADTELFENIHLEI